MKLLVLAIFLWSRPYVPVQVAELPPEKRLMEAIRCVVRGKEGEAVTHLLLLAQRHPQHPAAPWAKLAAAALYERQGDFIAARVWYDRASASFAAPASERILEHARRLDAEIRRLPVQAMRQGRQLLTLPPGPGAERAMQAFLVRFRPSPLHAEIRWRLASWALQQGHHFEALFFLMWSAADGHPAARTRLLPLLRTWPAPLWPPAFDRLVFLLLILWAAALGIRLWQCGTAGPHAAGAAAAVSGLAALAVPADAVFWPTWLFLATLRLWIAGIPPVRLRYARAEWVRWAFFLAWSLVYCLHAAGILHR